MTCTIQMEDIHYDGLELESESVFSCGVSGSRSGPICLSSSSSILSFALTTCHKEEKEYHSQEKIKIQTRISFSSSTLCYDLYIKTCTTILEDSIEITISLKSLSAYICTARVTH